ncbi:molybdopterin-dependent oxidoreductase [Candidatus Bathyarchaeota archaeon]|nr:molybdopterin-dependent oxidoreductase [Candidatus Bathyarchaeota archaeon]
MPNNEGSLKTNRRDFLKLCASVPILLSLRDVASEPLLGPKLFSATIGEQKLREYKRGRRVPSICVYCAGGCGVVLTSVGGKIIEAEGDPLHPINRGSTCSKLAAYLQLVNSDRRLTRPLKRTNPLKGVDQDPGWVPITWEEALEKIAEKIVEAAATQKYVHEEAIGDKTVQNYYHVGKDSPIMWHGSSYWSNEECYLAKKMMSILGSLNVEHQARKCHASTVVALANTFGFGAMTNHIIDAKNSKSFLIMSNPAESHTMEFKWVMEAKDNGAVIINLDPRFNRTSSKADIYARYRSGAEAALFMGLNYILLYEMPQYIDTKFLETRTNAPYDYDGNLLSDWMTNPNSIFNIFKNHVKKYTPEEVERIAGIKAEKLREVAKAFFSNKPGNIYYAMGSTQHTNAVQAIRAQAILQLLLGNIGVPGGGINALRGISNVQGSTDMNLLSHLIMGYRSPPRSLADVRRYQKWKNSDPANRPGGVAEGVKYQPANKTEERFDDRHFPTWKQLEYNWGIKIGTYPGIDPDNEPVICDLPIGTGNPTQQLFRAILDGKIKVAIIVGENNAVSNPNAILIKEALSKPGVFVVVNEIFETETAHFADILLPGTTRAERNGSVTNTGRWVQWHYKAAEPPGECRDELWFVTQLFKIIRAKGLKIPSELSPYEVKGNPDLTWPTPYKGEIGETPEAVYKEFGHPTLWSHALYRSSWDGNLHPELGGVLAKRRNPEPVSEQDKRYGYFKNWGWSWMLNQRVLYNVNEDPPGVKTFFVWWAHNEKIWLGLDRAAIWSLPLRDASKPEWNPLRWGLPLHNEPLESPDEELAKEYPTMWDKRFEVNVGSPKDYPYVMTTFRLAEHMQAGAMTRNLPWLVEAQPEMFVEISPKLAEEIGVKIGDYVKVKTARNPEGIRIKVNITERISPLRVNGREIHVVGMPWHWGFKGLSTGPSANDITIDAVDVSANIPEYKTCLCNVVKD